MDDFGRLIASLSGDPIARGFAVATVLPVVAEAVKKLGVPDRAMPLMDLVIGMVLAAGAGIATSHGLGTVGEDLLAGFVAGLVASGLYHGDKLVTGGTWTTALNRLARTR